MRARQLGGGSWASNQELEDLAASAAELAASAGLYGLQRIGSILSELGEELRALGRASGGEREGQQRIRALADLLEQTFADALEPADGDADPGEIARFRLIALCPDEDLASLAEACDLVQVHDLDGLQDAMASGPPDAIVLDVDHDPEAGAAWWERAIRRESRGALAIVWLSERYDPQIRLEASRAGASLVTKPVDPGPSSTAWSRPATRRRRRGSSWSTTTRTSPRSTGCGWKPRACGWRP